MNNKIIYSTSLFILFSLQSWAQSQIISSKDEKAIFTREKIELIKGKEIVCPASLINEPSFVPPPPEYFANKNKRKASNAAFEVTYKGFTPEARDAFQRAIDIWASLLNSPVVIRVEALWTKQDRTTLGSASVGDYTRRFPGQPERNVWYPIALAEKIAGQDINAPTEVDIQARFNSNINWNYIGTPSSGQYDLTTVVLHELCHGLGFSGSWINLEGKILWGYNTNSPFIYDTHVENIGGQKLIDVTNFPNNSKELFTQCTSDNLFFNGTTIKNKFPQKPKIYAPNEYQAGSSMSHLDDKTYPAGNEHALMTSAISPQEVNHNPGSMVLSIFEDFGWKGTFINHEPLGYFSENLKEVSVKATIRTENTLKANSTKVYYTENDTSFVNAKSIIMTQIGNTDQFQAIIPITKNNAVIRYYIVTEDQYKRVVSPAAAPEKSYYGFVVGLKDTFPPTVFVNSPLFINSEQTFNIRSIVYDSHEAGLDTVMVEYSVNGGNIKTLGVPKFNLTRDGLNNSVGLNDPVLYFLKSPFGVLKNRDRVKFRIMAKDKSGNVAYAPAYYDANQNKTGLVSDFNEFVVSDLITNIPVSQYSNKFDSPSTDFVNVGFSIEKPNGFDSPALHSIHPYKNGSDGSFESNLVSTLMIPIKISSIADSAIIQFDEVVLVEPGEDGSVYGDAEFYDYAIVEASKDAGKTWMELIDGYDSNENNTWVNTFVNDLKETELTLEDGVYTIVDSKAVGNAKLFKQKSINMLDNGNFSSNDAILIRFRLFSDRLTYGWGWAIDNLQIQVPKVVITGIEPLDNNAVEIYPNPTTDELSLKIQIPNNNKLATLAFYNTKGNKLIEQEYEVLNNQFNKTINTQHLPNGLYFIKIKAGNWETTKKLVINH